MTEEQLTHMSYEARHLSRRNKVYIAFHEFLEMRAYNADGTVNESPEAHEEYMTLLPVVMTAVVKAGWGTPTQIEEVRQQQKIAAERWVALLSR